MKLTNELLTQLINEDLQRVDERKIKIWPNFPIAQMIDKLGFTKDDAKKEFGDTGTRYDNTKQAAKTFSQLGGEPAAMDDFDVWIANQDIKPLDINPANVKVGKKFSDFLQTKGNPDIQKWIKDKVGKPPSPPSKEQRKLLFKKGNDLKRAARRKNVQTNDIKVKELKDLTDAFEKYKMLNLTAKIDVKLAKRVKEQIDWYLSLKVYEKDAVLSKQELGRMADVWTEKELGISFSTPDLIQTQADIKKQVDPETGKALDTELEGVPFRAGATSSGTMAVFQGFFDFVGAFKGTDTVESRTASLIEFAQEMQGIANQDPNKPVQYPEPSMVKGMIEGGRPDLIAVSSQVLKAMEAFSKEISKLESGKNAEAFLAALYSGGVSGGANGAADMIAGSQSKKVLMSAKIYSDLKGVKQKEGALSVSGKGVYAATQKGILFYIIGMRSYYDAKAQKLRWGKYVKVDKAPSQTAAIEFMCCGVGKAEKNGSRRIYPIHDMTGTKVTSATVGADGNVMIGEAMLTNTSVFSMGKLPLFSGDMTSIGMNSLDRMLNSAVNVIKDTTLSAIRNIYQKLEAMDNYTKVYTGDKARPADAAKGIKDNYDGIKTDFNEVLNKFGTPSAQQIKENKNQKLTKEILDKLIKQVIL